MSIQHIIVIIGIVAILFFANRIPDIAKNLGKGLKNFKNEIEEKK